MMPRISRTRPRHSTMISAGSSVAVSALSIILVLIATILHFSLFESLQVSAFAPPSCPHQPCLATPTRPRSTSITTSTLWSATEESTVPADSQQQSLQSASSALSRTSTAGTGGGFDIDTALFCAGLAFDSYVEPPSNSSRWERGVRALLV